MNSHQSRRDFLQLAGGGLGGLALTAMLAGEGRAALHHAPKTERVIQIFCPGGMSQVDTFDYKPELAKREGEPFDPDGTLQFFASKPGNCQGSHWKFRQHGESGRWMSDLFPKLATCVDDMAFVYSMHSKTALHGPACFMMNTGFILPGFPSMGSWVTYELGFKAIESPTYCYDLHATALHLLGIDHKRLTFYHNGIERRLTDVHGHVIEEIIH